MTGRGGGRMTAHQQPHWFLWLSGLTCKTEHLAFSPPLSCAISQLLQLESSARVYFHGWGVKTALSLFWLSCRSQWRRRGVLRTGAGPHGGHVEEGGGGRGWWGSGGVSCCGSLSNGVRGQLQQGGCQRGRHVMESHLCVFRYGDVRILPFPSLAMDGTEIRIHQLHDLSQL